MDPRYRVAVYVRWVGVTTRLPHCSAARLRSFTYAPDFGHTSYLPRELLQADWWDTGVDMPVGKGARRRSHGLVATLPFSSGHAVVYADSQTTVDVVPAPLGCVERLGGDLPSWSFVDNDASLIVCRGRARPRSVDDHAQQVLREIATYEACPTRNEIDDGVVPLEVAGFSWTAEPGS